MTSTFDNCILLNAILKNQSLNDDPNITYLSNLQLVHLQLLEEYHSRSEKILAKMREINLDSVETWTEISNTYVIDIVDMVKNKNYDKIIPAIRLMLNSLEAQYGVE